MSHQILFRRRSVLGLAAAGLAAGATAGCGAISIVPEPPQLYTLTPKSTFDPGLPAVDWQLLVEPPVAAAGLDTVRIALSPTPTTVDYYASVAWTDRAPAMVQRLLVESFENSGKIVGVSRDAIGLRSDYVLSGDLREFQAEEWNGSGTRARVRFNAKLITMPERQIVASETFEFVEPATGAGFEGVIAAFDEALGKTMRRVVEWTLVQGERHRNGDTGAS